MLDKDLQILCESAEYDVSNERESLEMSLNFEKKENFCLNEDQILIELRNPLNAWKKNIPGGVSYAWANGKRIPMMKVMQSNICKFNCRYCATRNRGNHPRVTISPEKLAQAFDSMYRADIVKGLFLTSGILRDADYTMELMLRTCRLLRTKYGYRGYIHLKFIPGVCEDLVLEALRLATRVSINFEASKEDVVKTIAPDKSIYRDDLPVLSTTNQFLFNNPELEYLKGGITTQFVVGAVERFAQDEDTCTETDSDLITAADFLYRKHNLRRAYYSGFSPITGTQLENNKREKVSRIHRLYQADFLLRSYNFNKSELYFDNTGNLPENIDPKTLYARSHPDLFPLEINKADFEILVRVPGIGPLGAKRIIELRRNTKILYPSQLKKMGIRYKVALEYILLSGRAYAQQAPNLFDYPENIVKTTENQDSLL